MTIEELYQQILSGFYALEGAKELLDETVSVTGAKEPEKTLRPENDPPSTVARPEYCVTATLRGVRGEAYTETPEDFRGTLEEALHIPPSEKGISAVTIAALNAAMSCLGLAPGVFPEEEEAHFRYAEKLYRYVIENHGPDNIVLVGYDGYLVKRFVDEGLIIWIMDRDPDHIAKRNRESSFVWGKYFIVTGSTLCNGTILHYLNSGKELLFYGITCAGAAKLLNLPWFSPENM